jgi:ABC-2 type transport system permease protein
MRLFRSELLRARSRRLVPMLVAGGMIAAFVGMTIAALNSTPASQAAIDQATAQHDRNLQSCLEDGATGQQVPPGYDSLEEFCDEQSGPYIAGAGVWLHDLPAVLRGVGTFVVLMAAWLGASLAGADWTNNTMATLLTWEPRRLRVMVTRAVVVAIVVVAVLLWLQVFFSVLFAAVAALFGTTALSPAGLWGDTAGVIGRVCAVGLAIGLVAYAVAMIGRSTVASLGALFGYLVLFEGVIAGFVPHIQSYLLVRAAGVIVSGQPIIDYSATAAQEGPPGSGVITSASEAVVLLSVGSAWVVAAVYAVGLLGLATLVFQRRDVT